MPATTIDRERFSYNPLGIAKKPPKLPAINTAQGRATSDDVFYPLTSSERSIFRTATGKRITPHQWAVYDFIRQIPCGKVTTYKDICLGIREGSPRSVGAALRNNPFAPYVPCHRVIAANLFIGGFRGEWGKTGTQCDLKMEMLTQEGVAFNKDGFPADGENVIWKG